MSGFLQRGAGIPDLSPEIGSEEWAAAVEALQEHAYQFLRIGHVTGEEWAALSTLERVALERARVLLDSRNVDDPVRFADEDFRAVDGGETYRRIILERAVRRER